MIDIKPQTVKANHNELPTGLVWYIIGQPKSGKTTALSKWSPDGNKGVLIIDTDMGADFVDGANIIPCSSINPPQRIVMENGEPKLEKDGSKIYEIIPPDERGFVYRYGKDKGKQMAVYSLSEIVTYLYQNFDKLPYDTIVLDTIDKVNGWNEARTCHALGIDAMGEGQYGADWAHAKAGVMRTFTALRDLTRSKGGNLVIVSHAKETSMLAAKGKKQKAQVQLGPALPSGLTTKLTGASDIIGYTTGADGDDVYQISFNAYDERKIGSRIRAIAQKELKFDYQEILKEIAEYKEAK